jgi:hypothetical protein
MYTNTWNDAVLLLIQILLLTAISHSVRYPDGKDCLVGGIKLDISEDVNPLSNMALLLHVKLKPPFEVVSLLKFLEVRLNLAKIVESLGVRFPRSKLGGDFEGHER